MSLAHVGAQNPERFLTMKKPIGHFVDVCGVWNILREKKEFEWTRMPHAK